MSGSRALRRWLAFGTSSRRASTSSLMTRFARTGSPHSPTRVGETYIAFEDDEPVGVVSVGHGVLQTLYVTPEFWSRGIGNALHDLALVRLRQTNVQEARLWTLTEIIERALLREARIEAHRPHARRAVPAPSDRRRVCPLDNSQRAARVRVTGATACPVPNRATGQFDRHR